jgi:PEP-CTERM motif
MKKFYTICSATLALMGAAAPASASVIVVTLPEYNGTGNIGSEVAGIFNYVIPVGETILSALFTSTFGNSMVDSSSTGNVTVDGITVGVCLGDGNPCWNGPGAPISYNFLASEFSALADGSATLVYNQTDCCVIRLGESTLTLNTGVAGVPEPASWALMLAGFGLTGAAMRRRQSVRVTYA